MAASNDKEKAISSSVLGLVRGLTTESLIELIVTFGITRDDAGLVLEEAKKRVQLAADFNRDEQYGLAINRYNRLIELNLPEEDDESTGDLSIALRAQIELSKLLRLHEMPKGSTGDPDAPGTDKGDELERVRAHLGGILDEFPDDYPVSELARIAADRLRAADAEK